MFSLKNITIFISIITFSACFNQKILPKQQNLTTIKSLNGYYKITSIDSSYRNLATSLFLNTDFNLSNFPDKSHIIQVKALNNIDSLAISLYHNDSLVKREIIVGKLQGGYFQLNLVKEYDFKKIILNLFRTRESQLYLADNNNLKVYTNFGGCSLFLVIPIFCEESEHFLEFARIKIK